MIHHELTRQQKEMAAHWQKRFPPARPSKGMVALYERGIGAAAGGNSRPGRWALLGCTPEIRSLAAEWQAEITCIDRDRDAFHAYKTICTPTDNEVFFCSDWLEPGLPSGFDVAIGDGAMSMLSRDKHGRFIENIYRILRSGGMAFLRIHVYASAIFENEQQVLDWYRRTQADKPMYFITRPFLYALWLDPETMRVSKEDYIKRVGELYKQGALSSAEYQQFDEMKNNKVEVQYTTKEEFERLLLPYFDVEGVHYAGDYLINRNHPVYFLRRKG